MKRYHAMVVRRFLSNRITIGLFIAKNSGGTGSPKRPREYLWPWVPIIFSWVSHSWQGASKRRKIPQKDAFSSPTKRRGRMNEQVRVVRRIHDEAITTFFAGEVMCYWGATRCNLCLHQGSRVHIVPGAPMKCPDNNGPPFVHDALLMSRGIP